MDLAIGTLGDVIPNFPDPLNFKDLDISERNDSNTSSKYEIGDGNVVPDHLLDPVMYKWFPNHDFPPTDPPVVPGEIQVLNNISATVYSQIESNDSLNTANHSNTDNKPTQLVAVFLEQFAEVPQGKIVETLCKMCSWCTYAVDADFPWVIEMINCGVLMRIRVKQYNIYTIVISC